MLGVVVAFVSSIFWGASDFTGGVSARKSTALRATLWSFVGASAVSVPALLMSQHEWSRAAVIAGASAGALAVGGFLALYASLATAPMGVVTVVVGAAEAIVPVVVGVFWHHDVLSPLAWIGIVVALSGATLIGLAEGGGKAESWWPLGLAAASGTLFGFSIVAFDAAPEGSGLVTPTVDVVVGLVLVALLALAVRGIRAVRRASIVIGIHHDGAVTQRQAIVLGLVAGVFMAAANITLLVALANAPLAIVGVVLCLYPVSTALLARFFLNERLTARHLTGIGVALAGCVVLALG